MHSVLFLASTSTYRRSLLERLGLPFRVEAPGVDEARRPGEAPRMLAGRLAREKAVAVAERHPRGVVIGSDQVCTLDGAVLGKPGCDTRAREQLRRMSGRQVDFHTAVAVARDGGRTVATHLDHTRVRFRHLDDGVIRDYVRRERPLDCAGAFRCEGLGIALFEAITGDDPSALIGLPLIAVARLLAEAGVTVLGDTPDRRVSAGRSDPAPPGR